MPCWHKVLVKPYADFERLVGLWGQEEVELSVVALLCALEGLQSELVCLQTAKAEVLVAYDVAVLEIDNRSVVVPDVP